MSVASLQALERRHQRIRELGAEIIGLNAQIKAKAEEAEKLLKEMEEISIKEDHEHSS